jgi:integrase
MRTAVGSEQWRPEQIRAERLVDHAVAAGRASECASGARTASRRQHAAAARRHVHDDHCSVQGRLRVYQAGTFDPPRLPLIYIKIIENEFGDLPVAALADRRVRGDFKSWRDSFAETPRKADYAWTTLARIMSFAKDRGIIATNRCERGGRLYVADRRDKIWTERDIAAVLAVASSEIQLALILALWSGQRQGDLLRLPWSAYESPYIRLRQSKGGRRVAMPAGTPLRVLFDVTERRGPLILTNTLGRPWTPDGFRTSWGKACDRAGVTGRTFHDLRGTAVVRLAIAGASVPQIAAVTGHSLKDVETILDAHYLGRDIQLAEAAVLKLEARTKL